MTARNLKCIRRGPSRNKGQRPAGQARYAARRKLLVVSLVVSLLPVLTMTDITSAVAAAPSITNLSGPATTTTYGEFESTASISPTPANPFDSSQIDVEGHFTSPGGAVAEVPGFYYQDYVRSQDASGNEVLTAVGAPVWKVRFSPTQPGTWQWFWTATTPGGTSSSSTFTVQVQPGSSHGYLTVGSDHRYLSFADGAPFFAVGENVAFPETAGSGPRTYTFDSIFAQLQSQGANYARVWMAPFGDGKQDGFGVEWKDSGLGDYLTREDHAYELDHILNTADADGIYLQLALLWHGAFSTQADSDWANNPYNSANGGPLPTPSAVFTNAAAQGYLQRLMRYVVARWGYSTHIASWELWNEVDQVTGYTSAASDSWHTSTAAYVRDQDLWHRSVTTSTAFENSDPGLWTSGGLDSVQLHQYEGSTTCNGCNWPKELVNAIATARTNNPNLPAIVGEESISTVSGADAQNKDSKGIGFHDALWAGLAGGAYGTGLSWWWQSLVDSHPNQYYPMLGAIARFVAPLNLATSAVTPMNTTLTPVRHTVDAYELTSPTVAVVWLKDRAYQWGSTAGVPVINATVTMPTSATGHWCGTWWDTSLGTATTSVNTTSGAALSIPPFVGDTALRLTAC